LKIQCIVNPASGKGRKYRNRHRKALQKLATSGYHETTHAEELTSLLPKLSTDADRLLVIAGGDGTVHTVLTALLSQQQEDSPLPMIALLPFGSTNLSALDLHGFLSAERSLFRLQAITARPANTWPVRRRSLLRIEATGMPDRFGFVFAIGVTTEAVRNFENKDKAIRLGQEWAGMLSGLKLLGRMLRGTAGGGLPVEVILDGRPARQLNCSVIAASTLDRMLFRLRYHWSEGGAIYYTEIGEQPPKLLAALTAILVNRIPKWMANSEHYHSTSFVNAHFGFSGDFVIDGEIGTTEKGVRVSSSRPLGFLKLT